MSEFLRLVPPAEAREKLFAHLEINLRTENTLTADAFGRVTAAPVVAPHPLPQFRRSAVDGYAVRAADTHGASEGMPGYLKLIGEVGMGRVPDFRLGNGECAAIHTGGALPEGADAVIMIEQTQRAGAEEIEILRPVAVGENALQVGEDVMEGEEIVAAGTRMRPAEIGGLMALGLTQVSVACRPKVGIISSGDEVVSPDEAIQPGQVRDVNTYTLTALIAETGGNPKPYGIVPDNENDLYETAAHALVECDALVITAGSSASARDMTARVVGRLGQPGVLVHGVNLKPGKPTILGVCDGKPVIGLPGNPVSALVVAQIFLVPVIEEMLGLKRRRPRPMVPARLTANVPSQAGREDWVAVGLRDGAEGFDAEPLFAKSNYILSLARADGLVRIPPDVTGLSAGERVDVWLL